MIKKTLSITVMTVLCVMFCGVVYCSAETMSDTMNKLLIAKVKQGDIKGVQYALDNGADINCVGFNEDKEYAYYITPVADKQIATALAVAVDNRNYDMIQYLLKKGANPNVKLAGQSLLILAINSRNPKLWSDTYIDAAENYKIVKLLIENGVDVSVCDEEGFTPLCYSVMWLTKIYRDHYRHLDRNRRFDKSELDDIKDDFNALASINELLIKNKASTAICDVSNKCEPSGKKQLQNPGGDSGTLLCYLIELPPGSLNSPEISESIYVNSALLLKAGVDPKIKDSKGRDALQKALAGGYYKVVDLIKKYY